MANTQYNPEVDEAAPEQLLVVFTRGRIVLWAMVAVLIHVVVIGVTSVGYIRDRWIDPEGAKARKEAAAAALAGEKAKTKAAAAPVAPAGTNAVALAPTTNGTRMAATGTVTNAATATNAAPADETRIPESRRETAVVKRITDKASTNEIPSKPDLGISLEETNPH